MRGINYVPILVLSLLSIISGLEQKQNLKSCQDPVTCYLDSVVIAIPDFCQDVNGQSLCISKFACNGIFIESLPSSYISPTTLGLGINGVGTYCAGDYSYGRLIKGSMTALINDTNVGVDLYVGKEDEFPVSTDFSSCAISSMNVHITFSSSGLDDLAPALEEVIKKAVNALVCVGMKDFFAVNVTNALVDTIDPRLKEIIASQATPLPLYDPHYMSWSDSIVSKIHALVDNMDGMTSGGDFLQCLVQEAPYLIKDVLNSQTRKLLSERENRAIFVDLRDQHLTMSVSDLLGSMSPLGVTSVPAMNSSISLDSLSLIGFDSMNAFDLLDPMAQSNVSLHTKIGFASLEIEIGITFTTTSVTDQGEALLYSEALLVRFKTHDVFILADLVVAVNDFVLKNFYLDQLSSPACWLSTLTELSIADLQLHLNVDELSITQVEGSAGPFEKDVIALLNNAVLLLTQGFGPLLTDTLNGVMQGPVRSGVNAKISESLVAAKQAAPCLSHYPYYDTKDYIVWADNAMVQMIDLVVNEKVGYAGVNKIMNCATNYTGELSLNTSHLHIKLAGLNSFYALKVLAPVDATSSSSALVAPATASETAPYELHNELGLGLCTDPSSADPLLCNPLRVIIASYDTENENSILALTVNQIVKQFKIVMSLDNLDVILDLLLKMDKNGMRDLTFGQMGTSGCKESTMAAFSIQAMQIALSRADVSINDGEHVRNITTIVTRVLDTITRAEKIATRNADMAASISNADATCAQSSVVPHSTDDTMEEAAAKNNEWKWEMAVLSLSCICCLICLLWAYSYWGQAKQLNCLLVERDQKEGREDGISDPATPDARTLWERLDCSNALVFHSKVPLWLQIALPIVLVGNMGMFLNSNMIPDAVSVMVEIDYKATVVTPDSVFDFGLASTVHDMWDAGVYPLAILIAFFSGAWPYIKLASMLVAWVLPPGLLTVASRESVLTWLDVLGKWSLIDFFVMILMLCAFFFELHIGPEMLVKVTVLPKWGFYGFLLATMISLGLGHIILACHRLVTEHKVLPLPDLYAPKESLASMTYTVYLEEHDDVSAVMKTVDAVDNDQTALLATDRAPQTVTPAESRRAMYVKLTTMGSVVIVSLILLTGFFLIAGTFLETMTFEFKGMVGLMLKDKAEVDYSFVSVGVSVPEHSGIPNDFAIRWMQGSFFLFGLAMPLALMVSLLVLWMVPLSIAKQRQLFVLSEVLNAWSTLDVYSVSIIAALLEIQQFAMFIVGDSCDGINKLLENFDEALEGDDKCFDVVAVLRTECWTIFLAACLIILVGLPSLSVCHIAIKHRMAQSEAGLFNHIIAGQHEDGEEERALSKDGKRQISQADSELCKPLLEDVSLHEEEDTASQQQSAKSTGSAIESQQTSAGLAPLPKRKSLWARLTCHDFNVAALTLFARMSLLEITSVDRSALFHRQQMLAQQQQEHKSLEDPQQYSPSKEPLSSSSAQSTPQVAYSDIYCDSPLNKDGRNVMVTHSEAF